MGRRLAPSGSRSRAGWALDRSIAVLLVRIGSYPLHHGTVGAIRSLGRLGVPVHAIVEAGSTPAARSRFLAGRFVWPTSGGENPDELVGQLLRFGRQIGGRPIAVATDDEAAVLLAEHAERLAGQFTLPPVPPGLPRQLASKSELSALCLRHAIPAARLVRPGSPAEVLDAADAFGFPVVLKNDGSWTRLSRPGVMSTAIISDRAELQRVVDGWTAMPSVAVQEHLPGEGASDWIAHAYVGAGEGSSIVFTGQKLRSWPPHAGVTSYAYSRRNPELSQLTAEFCRRLGFRGICDLDWRLDPRDGQYKLLDFNPRIGAQFRLFERDDGLDVLRAMHLDLSGRALRGGAQVDGRRYVVENFDLAAMLAYRRAGEARSAPRPSPRRELAWWAADDPVPALIAAVHSVRIATERAVAGNLGTYRID